MPLIDLIGILYPETKVEICVDYDPLYTGLAEDVPLERFRSSRVEEVYISIDGNTLVISVYGQRNVKKK